MYRRMMALMLAALMVAGLFTALAAQTPDVQLFVLDIPACRDNGEILSGIAPGASKEMVEHAGIVFMPEPFHTQEMAEKKLTSETWQVENSTAAFSLSDIRMHSALFQFVNDRLVNITLNLPDADSIAPVEALLRETLDEPSTMDTPAGGTDILYWAWEQDTYSVRVGLLTHLEGDKPVKANVQISYQLLD